MSTALQPWMMPKTRGDLTREQKMQEIVEAAAGRLADGGYNAVSVAAIARELGLAHNAIYWYFPSKDHLVVEAFRYNALRLLAHKPKGTGDVVERVMWFVDQLAKLYPIRASLHAEASRSRVIAEYLEELSGTLQAMARNALRAYVGEDDLELAAASFVATVQGAFVEGILPAERRRLLTFTLRRLIGAGAS